MSPQSRSRNWATLARSLHEVYQGTHNENEANGRCSPLPVELFSGSSNERTTGSCIIKPHIMLEVFSASGPRLGSEVGVRE